MREQDIKFKAPDGKTIYGTLTTAAEAPGHKLIIYAHGLPSSRNDYTYLNSSRLFAKKGYDTLRLSFYSWEKGARCLTDCDMDTHARDLEATFKKFAKKYPKLYLIGHSWGGPVTMKTDCSKLAAVSLWDPSYNIASWWKEGAYQKKGLCFCRDAYEFIISPSMHQQALSLNKTACRNLSKAFNVPLQVLHAGAGFLYKYGESYHTHAQGPTDSHLIKDADHSFLSEAAQKDAVTLTHTWFQKF